MRILSLVIGASALASCTMGPPPPPPVPSPQSVADVQRLLAGKVAGSPIGCIPPHQTDDMRIIDGRTLAFGTGSRSTTYMVTLTPGCEQVERGSYALLSRQFGGGGFCQSDIQRVVDTMNHFEVGSCAVASIVPYRPR